MLTFHHRNSSTLRVWGNRERHQHHTMRVWRQKFARSIPKLGKDRTRTTTQFLTGHSELNSRINKFKPTTRTVPKTCPHCLMEKETMNHFIGQCPKWSYQRGGYFESLCDRLSRQVLPKKDQRLHTSNKTIYQMRRNQSLTFLSPLMNFTGVSTGLQCSILQW